MNETQLLSKIDYYESILARCPNEPHIASDLMILHEDLSRLQAAQAQAQAALELWEALEARGGCMPSGEWRAAIEGVDAALVRIGALQGVRL
jgi:hypothetical protein